MLAEGTPNNGRLDSWKEIAAYLGKAIRTVQRWERTEGLPVHRLGQDRAGPVFAYKTELDGWWQQQSRRLAPDAEVDGVEAAAPPSRKRWPLVAGLLFTALIVTAAGIRAVWPSGTVYRAQPFTSEHGWEVEPSFSPDGGRIAYSWLQPDGSAAIYTKAIGADSGVRLTSGTARERSPAWSPDGRLIAFVRRGLQEQKWAVILIPASGGPETRIAELDYSGLLSWSPDGRWLLTSEGMNQQRRIVAIAVSTGKLHALTEPYEFGYGGFGLSPDLKKLIYCRSGPGKVKVMEVPLGPDLIPTGAEQVIVPKIWMREMIVTPDAKEILYTDETTEEGIGLWRRKLLANAKPELIHGSSSLYSNPAISRDQKRLAFAVSRARRTDTWKLNLDDLTARPAPLLSSTHSDLNPAYSPDGRHIAFHSMRSGASDIWVSERDGKNPRRLTFTNARVTATPRWSPDGGWIAYESNESGQTEVYVIRSNGGPAQRLTNHPATDAIPNWSRDGRWIYFCSDRTGRFEVWKLPAFGGDPLQVTKDGGFAATESADGKYLYYTQTRNSGPLWRVSLADQKAEEIIAEVRGLFYAVSPEGVYYLSGRGVMFWDAGTRESEVIYKPERSFDVGLALSPDGKELLFTQVEAQETDLYWIEGLR